MSTRLGDREADFAVAVIGGGVVGGTLAAILGATGLRVALVESTPSVIPADDNNDARVLALTRASEQVLRRDPHPVAQGSSSKWSGTVSDTRRT